MIRYKDIDQYSVIDFRDAITFTKLMARSASSFEERAKAEVAAAFCDMMNLIEPNWYVAAHQNLIDQAKARGLTELPVGDIGFSSISDIKLTFEDMLIGMKAQQIQKPDPQ